MYPLKSTLAANKCKEPASAWKWPPLLVTIPHGVTLKDTGYFALRSGGIFFLFFMKISSFMTLVNMLWFHRSADFIPLFMSVYLFILVQSCLLYPCAAAIMSFIKVWCQFQPPFLFTSPSMEIVPHLLGKLKVTTNKFFFLKACFTNLLNAILGSIFR